MNTQGYFVKRFDEKKRTEGSLWFLLTSMVKSTPLFVSNTPQSRLPFAEGLSPLRYPTTPENNNPSHFISFIAQLGLRLLQCTMPLRKDLEQINQERFVYGCLFAVTHLVHLSPIRYHSNFMAFRFAIPSDIAFLILHFSPTKIHFHHLCRDFFNFLYDQTVSRYSCLQRARCQTATFQAFAFIAVNGTSKGYRLGCKKHTSKKSATISQYYSAKTNKKTPLIHNKSAMFIGGGDGS